MEVRCFVIVENFKSLPLVRALWGMVFYFYSSNFSSYSIFLSYSLSLSEILSVVSSSSAYFLFVLTALILETLLKVMGKVELSISYRFILNLRLSLLLKLEDLLSCFWSIIVLDWVESYFYLYFPGVFWIRGLNLTFLFLLKFLYLFFKLLLLVGSLS